MFSFTVTKSASPISKLPNELLSEIASYVPTRHTEFGYIVEVKSLAALASTSRKLRAIATPFLFKEIMITSEKQLKALSGVPHDLLDLARGLNIFMDADFLAAFKASAFQPSSRSLFYALAKVLSHSPSLSALRIRVAHSSGPDSAWARTNLLRVDGIPVRQALERSLDACDAISLPSLKTLELDAFSGVSPLLRIAPNLERLVLSQSAGFAQYTNEEFLSGLAHVPSLKELVYTPESMRVTSTVREVEAAVAHEDDADEDIEVKEPDYSAELVVRIGQALPQLESLSLQTKWHGDEIVFPAHSAPISSEALVEAVKALPNLTKLELPSSVFSVEEYSILREPASSSTAPDESARERILKDVTVSEASTALALGHIARNLHTLSFIRPATSEDKHDSCASYTLAITPAHTIYLGRNNTPITRPMTVKLASSSPLLSSASASDALPSAEDSKYEFDMSKWVDSALENPMTCVLLAFGGGLVLGEAGRAARQWAGIAV